MTEIGPVVAPAGTSTEICDSPTSVGAAVTLPNFRLVPLVKLIPSTVTGDPTGPNTGEKSMMMGPVALVKLLLVVKLLVAVSTLIGPIPDPLGGKAWMNPAP